MEFMHVPLPPPPKKSVDKGGMPIKRSFTLIQNQMLVLSTVSTYFNSKAFSETAEC